MGGGGGGGEERGSFLMLTLLDFKEVNMAVGSTPEGSPLIKSVFLMFI